MASPFFLHMKGKKTKNTFNSSSFYFSIWLGQVNRPRGPFVSSFRQLLIIQLLNELWFAKHCPGSKLSGSSLSGGVTSRSSGPVDIALIYHDRIVIPGSQWRPSQGGGYYVDIYRQAGVRQKMREQDPRRREKAGWLLRTKAHASPSPLRTLTWSFYP